MAILDIPTQPSPRTGYQCSGVSVGWAMAAFLRRSDSMVQDLKQQLPESVPIWAVDTACVVPMRLLGKSYEKAWAYRSATQKLSRERLDQMPYRNSQTDFKTLGIPEDKVSGSLLMEIILPFSLWALLVKPNALILLVTCNNITVQKPSMTSVAFIPDFQPCELQHIPHAATAGPWWHAQSSPEPANLT